MSISTIKGTQLLIKVESQDSPNTFRQPCLINAKRGFKLEVSTNKFVVPDCDNPDDPAWQTIVKDALSAAIDGAGKLDTADVDDYNDWLASPDPRTVQVWLNTMGYWQGDFHLTRFEVTGDRGQLAEVSIALESDGAVPFTPQP